MNIQGISQNTAAQTPARQGNPKLAALDKQIYNLQKSIQEVRKNEKLDPKTKMEKVKEYQDQIQMIQHEKAQIQAEERQSKLKANENNQPSMAQEEKPESHVVEENLQTAFVKIDSAKNMASSLGVVREQIKGELRIAESKSFLRTPDPATAAKARAKLIKVDRDIMNEATKALDALAEVKIETTSVLPDSAVEEEKQSSHIAQDSATEEESDTENIKNGSGRMEPGQFLNDEV